jgi:hypothetical protein
MQQAALNGTLLPHHFAELVEGSGLTPETIAEAGIYSSED